MQVIEQLKEVWAKVLSLDLDEIEDDANFFERKGSSSENNYHSSHISSRR
jgi:hypothetical protein